MHNPFHRYKAAKRDKLTLIFHEGLSKVTVAL